MRGEWFDWLCWLAVGVTLVLCAFVSARFVVLAIETEASSGPPPFSSASVPSLRLLIAKTELEKTRAELAANGGADSVPAAIALAFKTHQHGQRAQALDFLGKQPLDEEQRLLVVTALLESSLQLSEESMEAISRYGAPGHAHRLSNKRPTAAGIPAWFALLKKWNAKPADSVLQALFRSGDQQATVAEMIRLGMGQHPLIVQLLANGRLTPTVQGRLMESMSPADRRGLLLAQAIRRRLPLSAEAGAAVKAEPPQPVVMQSLRNTIMKSINWDTASCGEQLPVILALDDEALNVQLEQAIADRARIPARVLGVQTALGWRLLHDPNPAYARLMKATAKPEQLARTWVMSDVAAKRPEVVELVGLKQPAETDEPTIGELDNSPTAKKIATALKALKGGEQAKVEAAYRELAAVPVLETRRATVVRALRAPIFRLGSSTDQLRVLAWFHWAGSEHHEQIARLAIGDGNTSTQNAATAVLIKQQSPHLREVARYAVNRPISVSMLKLWESSGENGADALCFAISVSDIQQVHPGAIGALGEVGGKRALTLLKSIAQYPKFQDGKGRFWDNLRRGVKEAMARIEERMSPAAADKEDPAAAETSN